MKVIVAGSRTIDDLQHVSWVISHAPFRITEIVSGGARGVDLRAAVRGEPDRGLAGAQ